MKLTEDQFEKRYAKKSGITIKKLHRLGLFAVPCDCGDDKCEGWAMITKKNLKDHIELYLKNN